MVIFLRHLIALIITYKNHMHMVLNAYHCTTFKALLIKGRFQSTKVVAPYNTWRELLSGIPQGHQQFCLTYI